MTTVYVFSAGSVDAGRVQKLADDYRKTCKDSGVEVAAAVRDAPIAVIELNEFIASMPSAPGLLGDPHKAAVKQYLSAKAKYYANAVTACLPKAKPFTSSVRFAALRDDGLDCTASTIVAMRRAGSTVALATLPEWSLSKDGELLRTKSTAVGAASVSAQPAVSGKPSLRELRQQMHKRRSDERVPT